MVVAFKSVGVILVCDRINEAVENLVVARRGDAVRYTV